MASSVNLRQLREDAGITQAELAARIGRTQSQVSRYEDAPDDVPIGAMNEILGALGTSFADATAERLDANAGLVDPGDPYAELRRRLDLLDQYAATGDERVDAARLHEEEIGGLPTVADLRVLARDLRHKPNVVFTGHYDAGKSRIANGVLGGAALPTSYQPATKVITYVRHVSDRPTWVREHVWIMREGFDPSRWHDEAHWNTHCLVRGDLGTLKEYGSHRGNHADAPAHAAVVFLSAPLLHACNVVDLPGFQNSAGAEDKDRRRAESAFGGVDVLVYVSNATGFLNGPDLLYLGMLLHTIPVFERDADTFPTLGNLFIVASHAHTGIDDRTLREDICDYATERLYRQLTAEEGSALRVRQNAAGRSIRLGDLRARVTPYWYETHARRRAFEAALRDCLASHLPPVVTARAEARIRALRDRAKGDVAARMRAYEQMLADVERARAEYARVAAKEAERAALIAARRSAVAKTIDACRADTAAALDAEYARLMNVDTIEGIIRTEYVRERDPKAAAKKYALGFVVETLQARMAKHCETASRRIAGVIAGYLDTLEVKFEIPGDMRSAALDVPFDSRGAFLSGLATIGTIGALSSWAASLGSLGGYAVAAKVVSILSTLGISFAGGSATVMSFISAIGGPVTLAIGLAALVAFGVWRLFGESWQHLLAKKIVRELESREYRQTFRAALDRYWDDTTRAFTTAADAVEAQFRAYRENLRKTVEERSREEIEHLLRALDGARDFFAGIPW
jgi:transcriptional regulator with XRE-family HTH domain